MFQSATGWVPLLKEASQFGQLSWELGTHAELRAHSVLAGLLLAVCLILAPSPALADTWGLNDGESGAEPDNSAHTWCTVDLTWSSLPPASDYGMINLENQTNFSHAWDCGASVDVNFSQLWIGFNDSIMALTTCVKWSGSLCDKNTVVYHNETLNGVPGMPGGFYTDAIQQTSCHEVGHTVGLRHADDDCMTAIHVWDAGPQSFSARHVAHVNCRCANP